MSIHFYNSPIGQIKLSFDNESLISLSFLDETIETKPQTVSLFEQNCISQLDLYFSGESKTFEIPTSPSGTDFQKQVWSELQNVAFGETISYEALSKRIGNVKAIRAVANANACNPLLLLIPCHRIIGKNGSLTGYAGGLWRKQWLLEHESKSIGKQLNFF